MSRPRLLFICVENSCRSQMAEAFARMYGGDRVEAQSAGSHPSGSINPKAIASMAELDYDLTSHQSKSLTEIPQGQYDYAITMGCGDACPNAMAVHHEDWAIPQPRDMNSDQFREVRDMVAAKVRDLLHSRLRLGLPAQ